MQVLAPAGSLSALKAAVYGGADAVYFGALGFNARMNATNFTEEDIREGIRFCHTRGVEVHATLNTLVSDRELGQALDVASFFTEAGVDAFIVQDFGLADSLAARTDVPLHASTQMTVHSLDGVNFLADRGYTRAVLSRELSKQNIEYIASHSRIETEIFAHGALCMCYSGQCYMSSVIGARSGNRGKCAQPCRLPYQNGYALSLKDMCLLKYAGEIKDLGVDCIKIEGRMKSPGYVYAVTKAYADAMRGKEYDPEEEEYLARVFSRDGFTDGYYRGKKGEDMFGVRSETTETPHVEEKEYKRFSLDVTLTPRDGGVTVGVSSSDGYAAEETVAAEPAKTVPTQASDVEKAFSRLGDTVYTLGTVSGSLPESVFIPVGALNALRRRLIESLTEMRNVRTHYFDKKTLGLPHKEAYSGKKEVEARYLTLAQIGNGAEKLSRIWVPLHSVEEKKFQDILQKYGKKVGVYMPTVLPDSEMLTVKRQLIKAKEAGITDVLCNTVGTVQTAQEADFAVHGDFGLNVFNSYSLDRWEREGLKTVTLSFEMNAAQISDVADAHSVMIAHGRLPFMVAENCTGKKHCGKPAYLKDRTGKEFLMTCEPGCRMRLWNADKLYTADKEVENVGILRLLFTDEDAEECGKVIENYLSEHAPMPEKCFTRGLYNKKV